MRLAACLGLASLAGCLSADEQYDAADREVYGIIADRRAELLGDPDGFTIDPDTVSLAAVYASGQADPSVPLGPFSLVDALELAAAQDTVVMARKESLYRTALDLTLQRFLFRNRRFVGADGTLTGIGDEADTASFASAAGFNRILGTGGEVLANIGVSLFRGLLSSDDWDPIGNIGLSITQPLLRGYGRRIAFEPLTQSERTLLYEVRSFERFRRTFAFGVANDYLRILQSYDRLRNAQANFEGLEALRLRNEALAAAGRLSDIQVDQARQNALNAANTVINEEQSIQAQLDSFKDILGLPISLELLLDDEELFRLAELGVEPIEIDWGQAVEMALANRYDYQNAVDAITDAERRVYIARDALRTRLDVVGDIDFDSQPGQPLEFGSENVDWSLGLALDLPIDNIVERNAYRRALIDLQTARRSANDLEQIIRIQVRADLRTLEARRETYEIQRNSAMLAERRVESTTLNFQAGRAQTRDLLEARDDELAARNSRTSALVEYRLALWSLFRDLELLTVDENGISTDISVFMAEDPS